MLINVFNKETAKVEKIDTSKLDLKKHFHRNTHEEFTNEDLKLFGIETKPKVETKPKAE